MIFPHSLPVEPVTPNLSGQDVDANLHIPLRVKQFLRRYAQLPEPLIVDLHQPDVIGFFSGLRPADVVEGLPDAARPQRVALDVDGKMVQGGFLPGYGDGQLTRYARAGARFAEHIARTGYLRPPCQQAKQQPFFHSLSSLLMVIQSTVC